MKNLLLCIALLLPALTYGQDKFMLTEDGLIPKFLKSTLAPLPASMLYEKALTWIGENEKSYELAIVDRTQDDVIVITRIKRNAVNLGESYFHAKYSVRISFENGHYKFEPVEIQLKVNSKYDMGWKDFDITDGSEYFKKGKPMRKYKSYTHNITDPFNELNMKLGSYLEED